MSADFAQGRRNVVGTGSALTVGVMVCVGLTQPATAGQPDSPWLYLSIAPDTVVSARIPHPDPPPQNLILSNMISQLPQAPDKAMPQAADSNRELIAQSVACLAVGGLATAATLMVGWQNVTNLISGGGSVPGATPSVVALGVFGVVFTSFCAIGQALTPLYLHYFPKPPSAVPHPPAPAPEPEPPGCTNCGPSALWPRAPGAPSGQAAERGPGSLRVSATTCGAVVAPPMLQSNDC
jgi:hypothetical protein